MKKHVFLICFLSLVSRVASGETFDGNHDGAGSTVFTAGEITVTGMKEHAKEQVTAEEIELLDKKNITDAVNVLPGITISNVGGRNEGMIYVRGFDMRQVPLFLDGIPLYVPYDGYIDPDRFTTFDLSEVTVSKGYTSVLYGPNTLGGAINMVSRKPEKEFEGSLRSGMTFSEEERSSEFGALNIGSYQGTWYLQGNLSILDRDFGTLSNSFEPKKNENGGKRDNSDTRDFKGSFKIGYTPNETDEYSISVISQQAEKGVPVYTGLNPSGAVRFWRYSDWDKSSVYFIGKKALGETSYLKARAYYDNYYNILKSYDDATYTTQKTKKSFTSRYDDKTFGGSIEFGTDIADGHTMKLAVHEKYDMHNEIGNIGEDPSKFSDNTLSFAGEHSWKASEKLTVVAGIRQDFRSSIRADDPDLDAIANQFSSLLKDNSATNIQFAIVGRLDERQELTAYLARTTRFPTLKDRYSFRMGQAIPNPDLKPEQSWNYGLDYAVRALDCLNLQASVYQSRLTDVIQRVDNVDIINSISVYQFRNTGEATFTGFECSIDWQPSSWFRAFAGYSYIDKQNDSDPMIRFTDVPRHKYGGYFQFIIDRNTWMLVETEYNTKRYSSSDGKYSASPYGLMHLRANVPIFESCSLQAAVENLFDRNYEVAEGFPESGREFSLSLSYLL